MSRRNYGGTLKDLLVHLRPEQKKRILYQSLSFDEMVKRIDSVGKSKKEKNKKKKKKAADIKEDYLVTPERLHSIIQQKSASFFILDTRSAEDYTVSHINLPQSLNVPEKILKPGIAAATIGKLLKIQERCQWERRSLRDMLIICDWTSEDFLPGAPVTLLRDALTKGEARWASHKNPPYLLEGGFQKFLSSYPNYVTNAKVQAPLQFKTAMVSHKLEVEHFNSCLLKTEREEALVVREKEEKLLKELKDMKQLLSEKDEQLKDYQKKEETRRKLIEEKEANLECPVCLETATVPIYMCLQSHLICSDCRPSVTCCPVCRERYRDQGNYRRHRYAERELEELKKLKENI